MNDENRAALNWVVFFKLSKQEKESALDRINLCSDHFVWERYVGLISIKEVAPQDEAYRDACTVSALRFCLEDSNFAKDVLSDEDFAKSLELFARKQYSSKLLKSLLSKFACLLSDFHDDKGERINDLLRLEVIRQTNALREEKAEKVFSPLKKQIEKVASGVKGVCYLAPENARDYGGREFFKFDIKSELNEYLKEKFSYDYNSLNASWNLLALSLTGNRTEDLNRLFQKALYNDDAFWEKHKKFNIIAFIEKVYEVNDHRHAEKILDYIFTEISKMQYGKVIIEKSLPLVFLKREEFLSGLEERTFRFTFDRFRYYCNLRTLSEDNLCYPFASVSNAEIKIGQGKQLVEEFLREIYPEDYERVLKILTDEICKPSVAFSTQNATLRDVKVPDIVKGGDNQVILTVAETDEWTIRHILDFPTFGYFTKIADRAAVTVYCPEYFSQQNIWNRFYLKAFYMLKAVKDKKTCFANLFEVYYDLFQFIEKKTGIRTSYQRNTEGRDEAFAQLKLILNKHGIEASDKFKQDYIISLLDRKVAIREESERFPVLEQLGDAVYGLAVAEMLFYSGEEIENFAELFEHYTCAKTQIEVAEKAGIDKLYLSSYSLPRKYESDLLINPDSEVYVIEQEREQPGNDKKYIADSLEMVIGTVCKDCGYKSAIEFTKKLLRGAHPASIHLMCEVRWKDKLNTNIDRDYWTRILPAPYSHFDNSQSVIWRAFDKFFKAYVLGTEDVATRRYITNSFCDNELYDSYGSSFEVNQVFYEYLHKGLDNAIEKFGDSVKEKYKELKK